MTQWQADALSRLPSDVEFVLLNCTNTHFARKPVRHGFYYLLNIVSLKTRLTRHVPLPESLAVVDRLDFEAEWEGTWQRFPAHVLEQLAAWRPAAALKFGMGLLRVPAELQCKLLSYHHGDPRQFRGRPCGFYEMLAGVPKVGQIVQVLANRLDAGEVVAFAETRVRPHSYRATMADSYRTSPLLLKTALANCVSGRSLAIEGTGKNYRLPSNWTVLRFAARLFAAKLRRLWYGLLFEKAWEVAAVPVEAESLGGLIEAVSRPSAWKVLPRPRKYTFLADPFPHPRGGFLVEALRAVDGRGEIVHIREQAAEVICDGPGHFSYPATVSSEGQWYLVPEMADWAPPRIYRLTDTGGEPVADLKVDGAPRLVDPTFHQKDGTYYLFANDLSDGADVLRLWTAPGLFAEFTEHPASPIRISPEGGRMAGALLPLGGRVYRFGQDNRRDYGNGMFLFEVTALSPAEYDEVPLHSLAFAGIKGPHTLNAQAGSVCFDFYRERFTPLAGVRRARALLARR